MNLFRRLCVRSFIFLLQMQHSHMDQKIRNVLFDPHLTLKPGGRQDTIKDTSGGVHLGVIVEQLVSVTNLLHTELPHIDSLIKKSSMVADMNTAELKKVDIKTFRIEFLFSRLCVYTHIIYTTKI